MIDLTWSYKYNNSYSRRLSYYWRQAPTERCQNKRQLIKYPDGITSILPLTDIIDGSVSKALLAIISAGSKTEGWEDQVPSFVFFKRFKRPFFWHGPLFRLVDNPVWRQPSKYTTPTQNPGSARQCYLGNRLCSPKIWRVWMPAWPWQWTTVPVSKEFFTTQLPICESSTKSTDPDR